jgi:hypothetical protein
MAKKREREREREDDVSEKVLIAICKLISMISKKKTV